MRYRVRGYSEYLKSDLYKEISKGKDERRVERKSDTPKQQLITPKPYKNNASDDIMQLKKDVREIKENVNKILELMNALYEFETSSQTTS
jgi:predicted nuclease of restriction endonuclease-like (RecB) superfamily